MCYLALFWICPAHVSKHMIITCDHYLCPVQQGNTSLMVALKKTLLLQVLAASYAEDEIQTRYYLTPFTVTAAHEYPRNTLWCPYLPYA